MLRKVSKWEKWLSKHLGFAFLRRPTEEWEPQDSTKDFIMAFHYCRACRQHRFDRAYDPLSRSAHFVCGNCGHHYVFSGDGIGILAFKFTECLRVASTITKNEFLLKLVLLKLLVSGLGKHLPEDREGKTAGELEEEALGKIMAIFSIYLGAFPGKRP
jgi:hypothetical protein